MTDILTAEERAGARELGAMIAAASHGLTPGMPVKRAAAPSVMSPAAWAKAITTVSVVGGVPLGIAAHIVGKQVRNARGKEDELRTQARYYRNASRQLESGLALA